MSNRSSEIVFAVSSSSNDPAYVFPYVHGSIKVPGPRRRGRPVGSTKKSKLQSRRGKHDQHQGAKRPDGDHFEFINFNVQRTRIDQTARKAIRRRAMLNYTQKIQNERLETPGIGTELSIVAKQPLFAPSLHFSLGHADPFNTMPIEFEPYMHDLLVFYSTTVWKTLYSIEEKTGCNPMVNYWLPLAFNDAALLNALIGCAASFRLTSDFLPGCPIFIKHLNEAMNVVNRKLISTSTGEDVSDETLAVIATLAMIQKAIGSNREWSIHMRGLKRLVDLRGGMRSLDDKPLIKSKIHRADLCGSVDITCQPYFNPHHERLSLNDIPHLALPPGLRELDEILDIDTPIKNTITVIQASLETLSTLAATRNQSHAAQVRFSLTSAQYALLSISYINLKSPRTRAQEVCRLAILLFTATAFNELPSGIPSVEGTVGRLIELLSDGEMCSYLTPAFQTWALCLASAAASLGHQESSLLLLSEVVSKMHVDTEQQFAVLLSSFLRDDILHQMHYALITGILKQHD